MVLKNPDEWEKLIGEQIKALRIRKNLKQDELASRAGVSKSALYNLEGGRGSTLRTLSGVLNALGETAWLQNLAPQTSVSPIQMLQLGKQRSRVR
jgi:transcriptional regulator with XRE-family HTH domain